MTQLTAAEAKAIARAWVRQHGRALPGFLGAFTTGSVNDLPDGAPIPATSDVDVIIVLRDPEIRRMPGKVRSGGVLLELSYLAADDIASPDRVLAHYHLGRSMAGTTILADPAGVLAPLQADVARRFADPEWIARRIAAATGTVHDRIDAIANHAPLETRFMSWLFAAGGVPHILLVAGLRNPTVRKRYLAVRDLLDETGPPDVYAALIDMLGCAGWPPETTSRHLDALEPAFDAAGDVVRSPFPFAADLLPEAKPVAIGGSRELVAQGNHREAVFWIGATWARCIIALHADAPPGVAHAHDDAFMTFLADLGIRSTDDLLRRGEGIRTALPGIGTIARNIAGPEWNAVS